MYLDPVLGCGCLRLILTKAILFYRSNEFTQT